MIRFDRFPGGKTRAVVFSFDDGQVQDRPLVALLNKYELKATFHLNSGKIGQAKFVTAEEIRSLYAGHEIACHGQYHARLKNCPAAVIASEILNDRKSLERIADTLVTGFAYPYGDCGDDAVSAVSVCGIEYARTTHNTHAFEAPADFRKWHPTNHILDSCGDIKMFLNRIGVLGRDSLLFIWGHSFELDGGGGWEKAKMLFDMIAYNEDIWYTNCGEYFQYYAAVRALKISADEKMAYNPSALSVWVSCDKQAIKINGGETVRL